MNMLKYATFLATALVALAACTPKAPDTAADTAAIKAVPPVWFDLYNSGDADGVAALYAEDGVIFAPGAPAVVGRAAIRDFIASFMEDTKAAGLAFRGDEVTDGAVEGDMGWISGSFSVIDSSGTTVDTDKYLAVLRRTNGQWQLIRDIWNSDLPTAPAPRPDYAAEPTMISAAAVSAEYVPVAGFPQGADLSVVYGDPSAGAFEMYFRLQPGVRVPMHFHTSAERSVGIQGTITMEYQDGSKADISPGNYMFIPSKMPHAATCPAAGPVCIAYFYFDQAFDVTWVEDPPENPNPMPTGS